jgi:hypothetical protein
MKFCAGLGSIGAYGDHARTHEIIIFDTECCPLCDMIYKSEGLEKRIEQLEKETKECHVSSSIPNR